MKKDQDKKQKNSSVVTDYATTSKSAIELIEGGAHFSLTAVDNDGRITNIKGINTSRDFTPAEAMGMAEGLKEAHENIFAPLREAFDRFTEMMKKGEQGLKGHVNGTDVKEESK